jgi:hypothetical protein
LNHLTVPVRINNLELKSKFCVAERERNLRERSLEDPPKY